ncbi:MAG: NADH-quinone oxidoreductase subunit K [Methanoregulaceae archaeon]
MIPPELFILLGISGALFTIGLTCLISRANLIKMVIGLEFLGSSVSLIFITGGYLGGDVGISQAVVFTLIIIEAIIAGVALALVIVAKHTWKTLDIASIARINRRNER